MKLKIQVIMGSTRENRFSEKPAKWIMGELAKQPEIEPELIDLRDWPLPFFDETMSPNMSGGKYKNELGRKWADKVGEADGYVIIAPEYNHGYPAVLKNALDWVYKEWNRKPVAFVAYGTVSGARSVEQLRQVAAELQMVSIRTAVHIPAFWTMVDEHGDLKSETLEKPAAEMMEQLIWWGKALKQAREKGFD